MHVERPWGSFTNITEESGFKIKKILVKPSSRLSLQSHEHRSEHWVIISGVALTIANGNEIKMSKDDHIYIPKGSVHRLHNIGSEDLVLIEVQLGAYLGEDDIKRYEDDYNRA